MALLRSLTTSVLLLFIATALPAFSQDDTRPVATWQVVRYDIAAGLPHADSDRNLTSKARLDLKNVSARPASTLSLRISQSAVISAVTINGGPAEFTKSEEKLGTGSLQRVVVRVPSVAASGSLS